MKGIEKAIWYIENNYRKGVSLDEIAEIAGVSRYHLSRMFCYSVGLPISRYIRLRRLSRAAIALSLGEPDILDLALSIGYNSHEAFSRAFKDYFNKTPEQVRNSRHLNDLTLLEPKQMERTNTISLPEPRFEDSSKRLEITGISRHYPFDAVAAIPDQWQSFAPLIARISTTQNPTTYGVIYNNGDDSFDYLSGTEVTKDSSNPDNLVTIDIGPNRYAVFQHTGHVATLRDTCDAIWSDWLPTSGKTVIEAPWFERYGEQFDPRTGEGGLEVWIPISK